MKRLIRAGGLLILVMVLAACASNDPAATIESYLRARIAGDTDAVRNLSCAAYEADALAQADSFRSMNAELQNMACQESGQNDAFTLVECEGKIVTTYANGEVREWELGSYQVIQEDGEWRMCGAAEVAQ